MGMKGIRWFRRLAIGLGVLVMLGVGAYFYVLGFDLDAQAEANPATRISDLAFVRDGVKENRGRILAVVTSTPMIGTSGKKAGFELTELSRAYLVFQANGFEVDIASPLGGEPPMRLDDGLVEADHAFLNDAHAMQKLERSLPLAAIEAGDYAAVYFVGGKGTMFDFPDNSDIQRIVRQVYEAGGVIGAVCHGPAALLNVRLGNGNRLIDSRRLTAFTNAEELFLIGNARELFPFLLQDRLREHGARFQEGELYLDNIVVDGRLVSGQNPWSTWSVAEAMIRALGHEPVARQRTAEEASVALLHTYYRDGSDAALRMRHDASDWNREFLLMHALVAGMQWRLGDAFILQRLARP
jgi:putative intracellular protease/amidase